MPCHRLRQLDKTGSVGVFDLRLNTPEQNYATTRSRQSLWWIFNEATPEKVDKQRNRLSGHAPAPVKRRTFSLPLQFFKF